MKKPGLLLSWLSRWLPPILIIMIIFWFSSKSGNEMTSLNMQFEDVSVEIISRLASQRTITPAFSAAPFVTSTNPVFQNGGVVENFNPALEANIPYAITTTPKASQTPHSTALPATVAGRKFEQSSITIALHTPIWLIPFFQYFNWLKLGHIFWYACLGLVFRRAFLYKLDSNKAAFATVLACAIYACIDEFHQKFVPGRDPLLFDVCLDTASAAMILKVQSWLFRKQPGTMEVNEG